MPIPGLSRLFRKFIAQQSPFVIESHCIKQRDRASLQLHQQGYFSLEFRTELGIESRDCGPHQLEETKHAERCGCCDCTQDQFDQSYHIPPRYRAPRHAGQELWIPLPSADSHQGIS